MIAFDTNILIYAEDPQDSSGRHVIAASLLSRLAFEQAVVPVQVLGEFINVCRRKELVSLHAAIDKVATFAMVFHAPQTEVAELQDAALLAKRFGLQFFDALIATVARRAGATVLLSEDMQDGLDIGGLRVLNPFAPANSTAIAALLAPDN
ncbi:MAG: PIN domain-containing protein [Sphingomonadales bacterium]|nr:PIN domain-containing protein [Sphingomonadales bacterium]